MAYHHISAAALTQIEGLISIINELGSNSGIIRPCGNANGNCQSSTRLILSADICTTFHNLPQFLRSNNSYILRRFREETDKFFTTITGNNIGAPQGINQQPCRLFERIITLEMAVFIIEVFKVVNINHEDRKAFTMPASPCQFRFKILKEIFSVIEACQIIMYRGLLCLFIDKSPLNSYRYLFSHLSKKHCIMIGE